MTIKHTLYKKTDKYCPESIKDRNGDIVLDMCARCGAAEIELIHFPSCKDYFAYKRKLGLIE
jgi:hypothetical protein